MDSVKLGTIVAFAGAVQDIPDGWRLCDGTYGTPDLRDRFIRGGEAPGATGEGHTHSLSEHPGHTHTTPNSGGSHFHAPSDTADHRNLEYHHTTRRFSTEGAHTHTGDSSSSGQHEHEADTVILEPDYYEVLFIMRVLMQHADIEIPSSSLGLYTRGPLEDDVSLELPAISLSLESDPLTVDEWDARPLRPPEAQAWLSAPAPTVITHYALPEQIITPDLMEATLSAWGLRAPPTADVWRNGTFDVYIGVDRSKEQGEVSPVVFSPQVGTILQMYFRHSRLGYRSTAYVGGQGEGVDRLVIVVEDSHEGKARYETFVDARDLEDEDQLENRGLTRLAEHAPEMILTAQVNPHGPYSLRDHYWVGDIVTLYNRDWGVELHTRIVDVRETWSIEGYKLELGFAHDVPTLIDMLQQEYKQASGEVRR